MNKTGFFILTLMLGFTFTIANAQNLVLNGDLELWDNTTTPTDWDKAENITQNTDVVHGGTYSAMHTSADGTQDLQQDLTGIVSGTNYTIRYYYYDNDPMARTRIWSYWMSGDEYLDDNEAELRPNEYSTDNPEWIMYEYTLNAPATADGFRFEVRVYKQDGQSGGSVYYDDFLFEVAGIAPEPTNYPTGFVAEASGLTINLTWMDAVGEQLPSGYLILASDNSQIDPPVDGIPVEDDSDMSDGHGALNIPFGVETCSFGNLQPDMTYYFVIYPYTNGGANIDYKTDGTAPSASALTSNVIILNYENFNDTTLGDWMQYSVVGNDQVWYAQEKYGVDNSPNAKMTGYAGAPLENDDWLISPVLQAAESYKPLLEFWSATKYDGPEMLIKVSTDYDGSSDPYQAAWTEVTALLSPGNWEWTFSGTIDLSEIVQDQQPFYVAFQYLSTDAEAATWEVDEILISAEAQTGIEQVENPVMVSCYPNPVDEILNIKANTNDKLEIKLYDMSGKLMRLLKYSENAVDLSDLDAGMYFVVIHNIKTKKEEYHKILLK